MHSVPSILLGASLLLQGCWEEYCEPDDTQCQPPPPPPPVDPRAEVEAEVGTAYRRARSTPPSSPAAATKLRARSTARCAWRGLLQQACRSNEPTRLLAIGNATRRTGPEASPPSHGVNRRHLTRGVTRNARAQGRSRGRSGWVPRINSS